MSHPLATLIPSQSSVLWVASSGGHFAQLKRIEVSADHSSSSHWVTFDTPQTVGALTPSKEVTYVKYVAPRDFMNTVRAAIKVLPLLRSRRFDLAMSTGSALAAAVLPLARALGIRSIYVESIARTDGPSLTGRLMAFTPGIETYTQYRSWSDGRWKFAGSVLDTWRGSNVDDLEIIDRPLNIFVTLGTIKPYRFDRLIEAVLSVTSPDDRVTWQLGCTDRSDLEGISQVQITPSQFEQYVREADVVVTHAGVGTILQMLDLGSMPVVAPRSKMHGEHVDDHQHLITRELTSRGLSETLDLDAPLREPLLRAAAATVNRTEKK